MKRMASRVAVMTTAAVFGIAGAAWAVPEVSNVRMQQRENTRTVDVWYDLGGEAAIVTLGIETNGVALSDGEVTRLSGDVCKVVAPGASRQIVWNAGDDWPEHVVTNAKARVTAWSTNAPPQIMVLDLRGGPTTNTYPVSYYTSVAALPYGGLTNAIYKSGYLVMRKIPNGSFSMSEVFPPLTVTLTHDFYIGVFEVTQSQWYNVAGSAQTAFFTESTSRAYRPMQSVSYDNIRGTSAQGGGDWPTNGNVYADSIIGRLRARTGMSGFDLPTEAQWEYACRAGTTTCFYDGDTAANVIGANQNTNAWLNALGRYKFNGGWIDGVTSPAASSAPTNGTAIVGSYLPNAWGLYDMLGNVSEWCLDWFGSPLTGGMDPKGADSAPARVARGGDWASMAFYTRSAIRNGTYPTWQPAGYGLRLVMTLP